jgi:hypothetical protein
MVFFLLLLIVFCQVTKTMLLGLYFFGTPKMLLVSVKCRYLIVKNKVYSYLISSVVEFSRCLSTVKKKTVCNNVQTLTSI